MNDSQTDSEHAFAHTLSVFSVSAGMIGVCLTGIGLIKIVSQQKKVNTLCDDLIVIAAMLFGVSALLAFRGLQRFVHHQVPLSHQRMDALFLAGLGLMIAVCGIFTWTLL